MTGLFRLGWSLNADTPSPQPLSREGGGDEVPMAKAIESERYWGAGAYPLPLRERGWGEGRCRTAKILGAETP